MKLKDISEMSKLYLNESVTEDELIILGITDEKYSGSVVENLLLNSNNDKKIFMTNLFQFIVKQNET